MMSMHQWMRTFSLLLFRPFFPVVSCLHWFHDIPTEWRWTRFTVSASKVWTALGPPPAPLTVPRLCQPFLWSHREKKKNTKKNPRTKHEINPTSHPCRTLPTPPWQRRRSGPSTHFEIWLRRTARLSPSLIITHLPALHLQDTQTRTHTLGGAGEHSSLPVYSFIHYSPHPPPVFACAWDQTHTRARLSQ